MQEVKLVLGTMTFGESVFMPDVTEFIRTYLAAGYKELDTAYVYNNGNCEILLGEALKEIDQPYEIATKANPRITGRLDYDAVYDQVNESLSRLGLKDLDLVYLHFPDPDTPVISALEAIAKLYDEEKIKAFGLSNFPAWMVADVCHLCDKHGWIKPTVYQGGYNPLTRKAENELNKCLDYFGMSFYAYNPLAGGLLTGKYDAFEEAPTDGRFTHRPNYQGRYWKKSYFDAVSRIKETAAQYNMTSIEATYRWLAYHSMLKGNRGDAIIIGASKLNHLMQNMETLKGGPLPQELQDVFEEAWEITKADSREYFTFYLPKK